MRSKFLLKIFVLCCLVQCVPSVTFTQAQEILSPGRTAVNTVYAEIFGSASGYYYHTTNYSVNYDRVINDVFALRIGASYIPAVPISDQQINFSGSTFTVPFTASYLHNFNGSSHNAEVGLGIATSFSWVRYEILSQVSPAFASSYPNGKNIVTWKEFGYAPRLNGIIGYRFQPQDGGLNIRAVFSPLTIIYWHSLGPIELFGGISIGYTF